MKALFLPLLLVLFVSTANAQEAAPKDNKAVNSLQKQFNQLKENSNSYNEKNREYKVVNVATLNDFWKSVQATISGIEQQQLKNRNSAEQNLVKANQEIEQQKKEIEALKKDNAQKEQEVQQSINDVTNLSVLGINMHKQFYVIFSLSVIAILLVIVAVAMSLYKSSKRVTDEKKRAYDEIDQEFNEYKKTARERELKVKRELQTEMNRIEELNQQIAKLQKHA
ncbi:hypothetical protein [Pontibacter ruber]|uniref:tRNA (Guanine-N1)-methyltransferase n=1 Tax=Pontibacter ruber TaxID=1343895 RepID=A0ABW5CY99_9BACT|nr:hypothetical protein [Pontibacter ruber]